MTSSATAMSSTAPPIIRKVSDTGRRARPTAVSAPPTRANTPDTTSRPARLTSYLLSNLPSGSAASASSSPSGSGRRFLAMFDLPGSLADDGGGAAVRLQPLQVAAELRLELRQRLADQLLK